jgi:hypothetical protein
VAFKGSFLLAVEGERPPAGRPLLLHANPLGTQLNFEWRAETAEGPVLLDQREGEPPPAGPAHIRVMSEGVWGEVRGVVLPADSSQVVVRVTLRRTGNADVSGRVVDGAGRSCGGVRVCLDSKLPWHCDVTDPEGRFSLRDVGPGVHEVGASNDRRAFGTVAVRTGRSDVTLMIRDEVDRGVRTVHARVPGLSPERLERVWVLYHRLGNTLAERSPGCPPPYRHGLLPVQGTRHESMQLEPGAYRLWACDGVAFGPAVTAEVTAGAGPFTLDLPAPPEPVVLTGRVVGRFGQPASGVHVSTEESVTGTPCGGDELLTDDEGRFRVSAVPLARVHVEFRDGFDGPCAALNISRAPVRGAKDLVIRLRERGGLRAQVHWTDGPPTGEQRGVVLVGLYPGDDRLRLVGSPMRSEGHAVGASPPGPLRLFAVAQDHVSWPALDVAVPEGVVLRGLVLRMRQSPGVTARVTDPSGRPLDDVRVQVRGLLVTLSEREARTDATGRARFGGLLPGTAILEAWRPDLPGCARASIEVRDPDQPATEVVLVLGTTTDR